MMLLNPHTTLWIDSAVDLTPVGYAVKALQRDWQQIFGNDLQTATEPMPNQIRLAFSPMPYPEGFQIRCDDAVLHITAQDDLGVVFGIYHLCETALGSDPLHFWIDYTSQQRQEIALNPFTYTSPKPVVRFRGWFVNDEDCLIGWHDDMKISLETWEQIFESLLRAGYNMVIPGTASKPDDPQIQLAADMGLWLAQHHAEPLGARLFSAAYPGQTPRLPEDAPLFEQLYLEAIGHLRDKKVVWSLGFRGQGDVPFYHTDPRYQTPAQRGQVIGEMIALQKRLVQEQTKPPYAFVHNVYSESAALVKDGHLQLDDDVIRVWADNGFGAMRARREWGPDPNIPSLPLAVDRERASGMYYHVNFHDLQLSNRLTPMISPDLIVREFQTCFESGRIDYVMLNVGNIRPHVLNIDLISRITRFFDGSCAAIRQTHDVAWASRYFPGFEQRVTDLMRRFPDAFFLYGDHDDDRAGEELCHWGLRFAIRAVIRNQSVFDTPFSFPFLKHVAPTNEDVFRWLITRVDEVMPAWDSLRRDTDALASELPPVSAHYFRVLLAMHIDFMANSYLGLRLGLLGVLAYAASDYRSAFIHISQSKSAMAAAWDALKSNEQGKWQNFYRGEWLTNVRETIRWLETLQGLCRIHGDTDTWWSKWMQEAMGMADQPLLATIMQASTDHDRLAQALADDNGTTLANLLG